MKYYKLLDKNNEGKYTGYRWDVSGEWMEVEGEIEMCENGFHVLRAEDIVYWLNCGVNLYEVEIGENQIESNIKELDKEIRAKNIQLEELSNIKNSYGWSLLIVLWRIRIFIAPQGSYRERILLKIKRGITLRQFQGWIRNIRVSDNNDP